MCQQQKMKSCKQGQLADFYPRENFGSRIGFCLWCHSDQAWLWDLIICLSEIQQNCINLLPSVQFNCEVMYSGDELSHTRSLFPDAILLIAQNLVIVQKLHKMTNVFHDFAVTQRQWNYPIVRSLALVPPSRTKVSRKLFSSHQESGLVRRKLVIWVSGLVRLKRLSSSGILVKSGSDH